MLVDRNGSSCALKEISLTLQNGEDLIQLSSGTDGMAPDSFANPLLVPTRVSETLAR
jgi:hypothetical protein